jgi:tetratricopeptide (TPR) repeat protein
LTSETVQTSLGDLFRLQDDIARRVVESLSLPLTGAISRNPDDAPHNARAYELYLRGNELARTYDGLARARDLYQQSLDLDPSFAPAWAHLGRCHRVIGKYVAPSPGSEVQAEDAFNRALELNPHLSIAHKFYAHLEADIGHARQGLVRLLDEASRHGNDPELFAGLVHACRYCGLFDESIAAHHEARRLDPNVPTSVEQTLLMSGDLDRLLAFEAPALVAGADEGIRVIALGLAGRREEARTALLRMRRAHIPAFQSWTEYLMAWLERRRPDMLSRLSVLDGLKIRDDPEAIFQEGRFLCDVGEHRLGMEYLRRAVGKGYSAEATLQHAREFAALRGDSDFEALLGDAAAGRSRALTAFCKGGGDRLLGLGIASVESAVTSPEP